MNATELRAYIRTLKNSEKRAETWLGNGLSEFEYILQGSQAHDDELIKQTRQLLDQLIATATYLKAQLNPRKARLEKQRDELQEAYCQMEERCPDHPGLKSLGEQVDATIRLINGLD
jgi:hypothetical protein